MRNDFNSVLEELHFDMALSAETEGVNRRLGNLERRFLGTKGRCHLTLIPSRLNHYTAHSAIVDPDTAAILTGLSNVQAPTILNPPSTFPIAHQLLTASAVPAYAPYPANARHHPMAFPLTSLKLVRLAATVSRTVLGSCGWWIAVQDYDPEAEPCEGGSGLLSGIS